MQKVNFYAYICNVFRDVDSFHSVLKCHPSNQKSVKQFDHSFAFDALTVWNGLPDEILVSSSIASFRKKLNPTSSPRQTHLSFKIHLVVPCGA